MAKRFLSYLPSSVDELPPLTDSSDDPQRRDDALLDIVPKDPRQVYKMHDILNSVCDQGSFFEIGRKWGRSMITGLARLQGIPVAIFAENPRVYGGAWTADASRKLIRLIDLAATFHLPLVHLEDCPGFLIGKQSEESGTIRYGSAALAALGQANVPFCCIVIRKAFGVAGAANHKPGAHHFRAAWPSGDWGSLPIEGGIEVAYKAELEATADYDAHLQKIKDRLNRLRSPFRSAEYFEIEEIIDPSTTRSYLCHWAKLARQWRHAQLPLNSGIDLKELIDATYGHFVKLGVYSGADCLTHICQQRMYPRGHGAQHCRCVCQPGAAAALRSAV